MTTTPDMIDLAPDCRVPVIWKPSSRARRLSVRIDHRQQALVVTLPSELSSTHALQFLKKQTRWITTRLAALQQAPAFLPGRTIPIEGKPHTIVHQPTAQGGVWIEADQLFVSGARDFMSRRITDFLRNHARLILGQDLRAQAQSSGLRPTRLDIRDTSSRWGSCSSAGRIMLSWRLVMAPAPVRHYLIAHELAHLRHMNHGPAFWALADQLTPHRHHAEAWLKQHGPSLLGAR
nr:SprT family zinc-dependent metalloprotease [uncultured Acetobacter sp.]